MSRSLDLPRPAWTDRGQGHPLVLLHGFGAHGASWAPWLPELERRYRVLNVDLGGFGRAAAPLGTAYGLAAQAEAVLAWVREMDLRRFTLVGHSLGGGIALLMALHLQHEEEGRLASLVSVAGAAYHFHPEPPFVRMARRPRLSRVALEIVPKRWLIRTVMRQIVVQQAAVTEARVASYAEPLGVASKRRALIECARNIVPPDLDRFTERFRELRAPTLCLWGRQDPVMPLSVGERLAAAIPGAEMVVLERCGHLPVEEHPEESLAVLLDFLERRLEG
jgi:pimeloyl-ACP methyl ester carboxylesterase